MERIRTLLTGPFELAAIEEVCRLLPEVSLTAAERREVAALLEGATRWLDNWSAELRLLRAEPVSYGRPV